MYSMLWKASEVDDLIHKFEKEIDGSKRKNYLEIILPIIKNYIELLNSNYGVNRDPNIDGGWVALFTEPITEENAAYKELLGKYNIPSSEYAEINEYIAEDAEIRYTMQLFVMTEYHLIIIYPSFKKNKMTMSKCFEIVPPRRYMTSDIKKYLPQELVMFLWKCVDEAGRTMSLDYLQVFKLRVVDDEISGKLRQCIIHSQEVPPYAKEYRMDAIGEGINGKILVIDNIEYQTMMWD